jgi:hypothetical protein
MNAQVNEDNKDAVMAQWFENSYKCSECDTTWTDEWSCMCNDRCPECDCETEPTDSVDLSRALTKEDYIGAARLISNLRNSALTHVTDEDAKAYAEAILEGGEYRFSHSS